MVAVVSVVPSLLNPANADGGINWSCGSTIILKAATGIFCWLANSIMVVVSMSTQSTEYFLRRSDFACGEVTATGLVKVIPVFGCSRASAESNLFVQSRDNGKACPLALIAELIMTVSPGLYSSLTLPAVPAIKITAGNSPQLSFNFLFMRSAPKPVCKTLHLAPDFEAVCLQIFSIASEKCFASSAKAQTNKMVLETESK